jgi:hypothetical protein
MIRTVGLELAAAGTAIGGDVIAAEVLACHVAYGGGTAVISTAHSPSVPILSVPAGTGWYYPRGSAVGSDAVGLTFDGTYIIPVVVPVCDHLQVVADDACSVQLIVRG